MTEILSSALIVYSWIVAAALVFFLFLIGRFYEVRFGGKSYYQLLLLPLSFFVLAAFWDVFGSNEYTGNAGLDFVGAFWSDLLLFLGGVGLIVLCYALFRLMMGGRG